MRVRNKNDGLYALAMARPARRQPEACFSTTSKYCKAQKFLIWDFGDQGDQQNHVNQISERALAYMCLIDHALLTL